MAVDVLVVEVPQLKASELARLEEGLDELSELLGWLRPEVVRLRAQVADAPVAKEEPGPPSLGVLDGGKR